MEDCAKRRRLDPGEDDRATPRSLRGAEALAMSTRSVEMYSPLATEAAPRLLRGEAQFSLRTQLPAESASSGASASWKQPIGWTPGGLTIRLNAVCQVPAKTPEADDGATIGLYIYSGWTGEVMNLYVSGDNSIAQVYDRVAGLLLAGRVPVEPLFLCLVSRWDQILPWTT